MLQVNHISFSYHKEKVINDVSFDAQQGEHITIIGESGSGKSTLLKLLYGEYDLDEGQIFWKNTEILGPKFNLVIGYDFMKYVAQEFDLMPFITVEENIGKYLSNFFPEEKQKRTKELLKVVELEAFAKTKVKYLSGGQKQRVAIARALAKQPEIILLDEPFSHIDNFKKQSLRRNVFNYLKANNITCITATHDKNDALGFADKMMVIHQSQIIASDTPQNLYKNPKTPLIASFFGECNVIDSQIYYSHQIKITEDGNLQTIVKQSYFQGDYWLVELQYNSQIIYVNHGVPLEPKTEVNLSF